MSPNIGAPLEVNWTTPTVMERKTSVYVYINTDQIYNISCRFATVTAITSLVKQFELILY